MESSAPGTFTARRQRTIAADRETTFAAWTDPELLEAWMSFRESGGSGLPVMTGAGNARIAPAEGAPFTLDMLTREADGTERRWNHRGHILAADPPTHLALTWISEGTGQATTVLTLDFADAQGGTALTLTHAGFATREMADEHAQGWDLLLDLLNEALMSAATVGAKIAIAEIKRRLAARKAGAEPEPESEG